MLNFKFTIARSHFRIWVAILSINRKVKGYEVSRQVYWCQSCRRGRKRDQPVCRENRRVRIAQVEILSAHSYVIIRERVQEIVMVLSTERVDATTRQTQPRSPVIWFESAAQIASNVFTIRYTGICRSISHDFATPKVGRSLPLVTFHHLHIKPEIYYVRVYNITPQYFIVESLFWLFQIYWCICISNLSLCIGIYMCDICTPKILNNKIIFFLIWTYMYICSMNFL